jgi:hypothetical protein
MPSNLVGSMPIKHKNLTLARCTEQPLRIAEFVKESAAGE